MAARVACVRCGELLGEDENFCIRCGTRREMKNDREPTARPPARRPAGLALPLVLLVVAALVWGAWKSGWSDKLIFAPPHGSAGDSPSGASPTATSKAPPTALDVPLGNYDGEP